MGSEFEFEGRCIVRLEHIKGSDKSRQIYVKYNLDISTNLQRDAYFDKDGLPSKDGAAALTEVFVQGLIANLHTSHEKGFRDSAEHLRYIITELERGFIEVTRSEKSTFNS